MEKHLIPQATSPLATWLSYLENLHSKTIDLGLARVSLVAGELDVLQPAPFVFTVAGTNGKGTTCRTLETILMAAGYTVGVYSSPHLVRYTERVRVQGAELAESAHTASFAAIEAARGDTSLTYFEYGTLSALWLFKQHNVDVAILEVGLGGRLDATNIVDANVAVVTSIALDHTDWLGPDRESIGREKAGVFRGGRPAVVGEPDMPHTIADVAQEKGALLMQRDVDWRYTVQSESWTFSDGQGELNNLPLPNVPQPNAATALAALRASGLKVSEQAIREGIASAILPGRFQTIQLNPRVILDVAHNPHAAGYLAGRLNSLPKTGRVLAVIGMLHDKDIAGTLACLEGVVDSWYCAPLEGPRGATAEQLREHLRAGTSLPKTGRVLAVIGMLHDKDIAGTLACLEGVVDSWYCAPLEGPRGATAEQLREHLRAGTVFSSVTQAWHAAMSDAAPEDIVLVCGSFHTVAHVMEALDAGSAGGK